MDLEHYKTELLTFTGITRKHGIKHVIDFFPEIDLPENSGRVVASWGEDAAVLDTGGPNLLLLAADGIMNKLMDADPFWAGYCSVLVNIHDIIAMGGLPVAMVNILSITEGEAADRVLDGMKYAVEKFGVPIVGGHTHPDNDDNSISVAILGTVERDHVLYSHKASAGDEILLVLDLDGKSHPVFEFSWDTTRHKSYEQLWMQMNSVREVAEGNLATACKDISNPGIIGTIGMMAECSGVGAAVDLDVIPCPEGLELIRWLKMYQGMGFILTSKAENSERILEIISKADLSAARIGSITNDNKLIIKDKMNSVVLFDLSSDPITGIKP